MMPFRKFTIGLLISCLIPQVVASQEDFDSVRKQAMGSGSRICSTVSSPSHFYFINF
jgi:hypothetical protein